jgi:hypothetical protein
MPMMKLVLSATEGSEEPLEEPQAARANSMSAAVRRARNFFI